MEIAPRIQASEWMNLSLDDDDSPDWPRAIDIFRARIEARYFEPVELLLELDERRAAHERRFGFTILAIDCLLVETLQAFRDGLKDTRSKSREMFKRFLSARASFKKHFDEDKAEGFFYDVRCGILHQGEVRGGVRVWSVGKMLDVKAGQTIVNRSAFHAALRHEFTQYLAELGDPTNKALRENLRKKLDHICATT